MAAFIPSRPDAEVKQLAFARVREDKERDPAMGSTAPGSLIPISCQSARRSSTGTSVTVPISLMSGGMTSRSLPRSCWMVSAVPGTQAEAGLRDNVDVGLRCLEAWLGGDGAVGIHNRWRMLPPLRFPAPRSGSGRTTMSAKLRWLTTLLTS